MAAAPEERDCDNCGNFGPGREQWMFSSVGPFGRCFFCFRCLARMRLYAVIAFTLLSFVLLAIVAFVLATLWRLNGVP
jgi:hypothetical protein